MLAFTRLVGARAAARTFTHARITTTRWTRVTESRPSLRVAPHYQPTAPWSALFSTNAIQFSSLPPDDSKKKDKDFVYTPPPADDNSTKHGDETADRSGEDEVPLTSDAPPADAVSCTVSPPDTEAFLKPTPVVLLTGPFGGNWCFRDTWQAILADQGYQSTSIELAMPAEPLESGDAYVRHFVKLLKKSIETDHSFFPPILIAHGFHTLVAEKYVESNPVSALVLVSPYIPTVIKNKLLDLAAKAQSTDYDEDAADGKGQKESEQRPAGQTAATIGTVETATALGLSQIKTHGDLLKIPGFKSKYVMPAKAVYKVDRIAKEAEDKEKKDKEESATKGEEKAADAVDGATHAPGLKEEQLGHDSVPVLDKGDIMDEDVSSTTAPITSSPPPEMIVESEASMPSPLEQLPLSIYDSIPTSNYEPLFPILLLTSQGDLIVSTSDVEQHHHLAGEVDHVELGDGGDGGHLIMVGDNTEWEEGIMGITEWLDSNGM